MILLEEDDDSREGLNLSKTHLGVFGGGDWLIHFVVDSRCGGCEQR
jgi:hypothetical protein